MTFPLVEINDVPDGHIAVYVDHKCGYFLNDDEEWEPFHDTTLINNSPFPDEDGIYVYSTQKRVFTKFAGDVVTLDDEPEPDPVEGDGEPDNASVLEFDSEFESEE